MLVGLAGSGKSVLTNDSLKRLPTDDFAVTQISFNFYTTSMMLQFLKKCHYCEPELELHERTFVVKSYYDDQPIWSRTNRQGSEKDFVCFERRQISFWSSVTIVNRTKSHMREHSLLSHTMMISQYGAALDRQGSKINFECSNDVRLVLAKVSLL